MRDLSEELRKVMLRNKAFGVDDTVARLDGDIRLNHQRKLGDSNEFIEVSARCKVIRDCNLRMEWTTAIKQIQFGTAENIELPVGEVELFPNHSDYVHINIVNFMDSFRLIDMVYNETARTWYDEIGLRIRVDTKPGEFGIFMVDAKAVVFYRDDVIDVGSKGGWFICRDGKYLKPDSSAMWAYKLYAGEEHLLERADFDYDVTQLVEVLGDVGDRLENHRDAYASVDDGWKVHLRSE